jgi:hypothetical protein
VVVECSILVELSVYRDMLTEGGSSWGENVITPKNYNTFSVKKSRVHI